MKKTLKRILQLLLFSFSLSFFSLILTNGVYADCDSGEECCDGECTPGNYCDFSTDPPICRSGCISDESGLPGKCVIFYCPGGVKEASENCSPGTCCVYPSNSPSATSFSNWITTITPNFDSDTTIGDIISELIPYIFAIAGFAMLIFIVLGGYQIMISQGDPKQMAAGREKITYAIIGLVIMFASYWIVQLLGLVLDIKQIQQIF